VQTDVNRCCPFCTCMLPLAPSGGAAIAIMPIVPTKFAVPPESLPLNEEVIVQSGSTFTMSRFPLFVNVEAPMPLTIRLKAPLTGNDTGRDMVHGPAEQSILLALRTVCNLGISRSTDSSRAGDSLIAPRGTMPVMFVAAMSGGRGGGGVVGETHTGAAGMSPP